MVHIAKNEHCNETNQFQYLLPSVVREALNDINVISVEKLILYLGEGLW